jgi:hypothetical protein
MPSELRLRDSIPYCLQSDKQQQKTRTKENKTFIKNLDRLQIYDQLQRGHLSKDDIKKIRTLCNLILMED